MGSRSRLSIVLAIALVAGSAIAAEAQDAGAEAAENVPFTMSFSWRDPSVRSAVTRTEDGITKSIGDCWAPVIVAPSDPRMDGTLEYCGSEHVYGDDRDADTVIWTETYRITNQEGAWQGSSLGAAWEDPGSERIEAGGDPLLMVGEGAYDGLYAALTFVDAWSDIRGVIFDGAPPADAVPPSAESMGLVTEEIEPGVERIVSDSAGHDLDATHPTYRYDMDDVFVLPDGTVWLSSTFSREDNDANPGAGALTWALGRPDAYQYSADSPSCGTEGMGVSCWDPVAVREVTYLAGTPISAVAVAPDGTVWAVGGYDGDNGGLYRITLTPPEPVADTAAVAAFTEVRVADVTEVDDRTRDLIIESPSVGEAKVRLLLPAGFDEDADRTYPVLYLLHGATGDHSNWTEESDLAELTADLDLLVVMPDGGEWGWYSDWWNEGEGGPPAWETFHLDEVRGIIEDDWRAGDARAVAGLSMGGYGAMHYATAHPELFEAVASFSGVVDPNGSGRGLAIDPMAWGDPVAQSDVWDAHDPVAMAAALDGKPVYLSWGDGQPGPLDATGASYDDLEAWVAPQNEALAARLAELGIDATVESGVGTHTWPYWEQGLHNALPLLLEALEQ